ncbi:MAG: uridine kinase [Eubacteriales bacterium]|nr:uridine kinase [Eubacteriales bacterium]
MTEGYLDYKLITGAVERLIKENMAGHEGRQGSSAGSKPPVIGIEGRSGSGKSTLAEKIAEEYDCNVFHMDHFFLPPEMKTAERLAEAGGNVHYERFCDEVVRGIQSGRSFSYGIYDCKKGMLFKGAGQAASGRINIVEGCYSMHPYFGDIYDLKIFLDISKEEQSRRILERSGPSLHRRFMDEWIPLEENYLLQTGIRDKCDLAGFIQPAE